MAETKPKAIKLADLKKAVTSAAKLASERHGIHAGEDVLLNSGFVGIEITDGSASLDSAAAFAADVVKSISKGPAKPLGPITPAVFRTMLPGTWAGGIWGPIPESWLKGWFRA